MIHAGRFTERVTIQRRTATQSATGDVEAWEDVETRWAVVAPMSSRMRFEYAQRDSIVTHRVVLREAVELTLGEHRFKWRGRVLVPAEPPEPIANRQSFSAVPVRLSPEDAAEDEVS